MRIARFGQRTGPVRVLNSTTLRNQKSFLSSITKRNAFAHPSSLNINSRYSVAFPLLKTSSISRILCRAAFTASDIATDVGVMIEGEPALSESELESLSAALYADSNSVVQQAAMVLIEGEDRDTAPGPLELSLVLCDDPFIRELNKEWRGTDAPTDVLSFEMGEEEFEIIASVSGSDENISSEEEEEEEELEIKEEQEQEEEIDDEEGEGPATVLGDVVISLDTAARQAKERGHSLQDECRILVVHGVLHLLGYDHENGGEEEKEMAEAEVKIMKALGWKGQGLIAAAAAADGDSSNTTTATKKRRRTTDVKLLALDMDGTLLDSTSNVLPSSVSAIKAALDLGVTVMLATGKARPAAMAAMKKVGLAGDGLVVGPKHPGLFLQGLAVHSLTGDLIDGGLLPPEIVRAAFEYALQTETPICGFLGDECVTIGRMTPEIELLHTRFYEPLATVAPSVDSVLQGPQLRKLLFMTSPEDVKHRIRPEWEKMVQNTGAAVMQAVPEMLEITPRGWNKFVGLEKLLKHSGVPLEACMAIGDGGNDFELVSGVGRAGVGVAMGNAVPEVKEAATAVVATNDEGGIAEAIEKFILSSSL